MKNAIASIIGLSGFLLLMGVVGSDCDGKCMEDAMSLGDTIKYGLIGLGMMVSGLLLGGAFNEPK